LQYLILSLVKKHISALILFIVFFIPTTVKFTHIFQDHGCVAVCNAKKDKKESESDYEEDCEICSFHFTPFSVNTITFISSITFNEIKFYNNLYTSFKYNIIKSFLLRGPPSLV